MRALVILLAVLVASPAISGEGEGEGEGEAGRTPRSWLVRAIVDTDELICPGSVFVLTLRDPRKEVIDTIIVPLKSDDWGSDHEWVVDWAAGSRYTIGFEVTSCSGLRMGEADLTFEVSAQEVHRSFYVVAKYHKTRPRLTYVETGAYYSGLLNVTEDAEEVVIRNVSSYDLSRCGNPSIDRIDREYFVDGTWSGFNHQRTYSWPDDLENLPVGATITIQPPQSYVVGHDPKLAKVKPERKRYVVFTALDDTQYRVIGRRDDVPMGLPGCNVHYLEAPITDRDPSVQHRLPPIEGAELLDTDRR